jgi:hypothetical protein
MTYAPLLAELNPEQICQMTYAPLLADIKEFARDLEGHRPATIGVARKHDRRREESRWATANTA